MEMNTWQKTRKRHLALIEEVEKELPPTTLHITKNSKTGVSIDFPAHLTCAPTRVCMGVGKGAAPCYALSGYMTMAQVVKCQARDQRLADYLVNAPIAQVWRVVNSLQEDLPSGLEFIRWNGAGDLTLGACMLINCITFSRPDLRLWVVSRKPEMVTQLSDRPSLQLILSLDHSTPILTAHRLRAARYSFIEGRAQLSYTRVSEEDTPPEDIDIVFNKHSGGRFNGWPHPKVCVGTLPGRSHENACEACGRCFR